MTIISLFYFYIIPCTKQRRVCADFSDLQTGNRRHFPGKISWRSDQYKLRTPVYGKASQMFSKLVCRYDLIFLNNHKDYLGRVFWLTFFWSEWSKFCATRTQTVCARVRSNKPLALSFFLSRLRSVTRFRQDGRRCFSYRQASLFGCSTAQQTGGQPN